jgi:hypothetical protein
LAHLVLCLVWQTENRSTGMDMYLTIEVGRGFDRRRRKLAPLMLPWPESSYSRRIDVSADYWTARAEASDIQQSIFIFKKGRKVRRNVSIQLMGFFFLSSSFSPLAPLVFHLFSLGGGREPVLVRLYSTYKSAIKVVTRELGDFPSRNGQIGDILGLSRKKRTAAMEMDRKWFHFTTASAVWGGGNEESKKQSRQERGGGGQPAVNFYLNDCTSRWNQLSGNLLVFKAKSTPK